MSPEQHAKVLQALELSQPARCGQSDDLYAQEAATIREALSIMRAVQVGDVPTAAIRQQATSEPAR